jgi:hypothetical protein
VPVFGFDEGSFITNFFSHPFNREIQPFFEEFNPTVVPESKILLSLSVFHKIS